MWDDLLDESRAALSVIVMTFWYVFIRTDLSFSNFFFYFSLGIDHEPPCSLCSHDLCLFPFPYVSFFTRLRGQEKSLSYYDLLCDFKRTILRTHPHSPFLLLPLQPHHPYTPHLCRSTTAPLGEGYHPSERYDYPASHDCTSEDSRHSRLGTAMVKLVLPSRKSAQPDRRCCREPSPD